jgi:hypothetical protein
MSVRRLFVALAVLGLVISSLSPCQAGAQTVWLYAFQIPPPTTDRSWTMGVSSQGVTPSSEILGHPPRVGATGEIAVMQGIISVGGEVPLPVFADGSQAQEGEVFWTAQLWLAEFFSPQG